MAERIYWWRTDFHNGESEAIAKAIAEEHISQGPIVEELEKQLADYLGVPYAVATTSGSMALLMSLWAAGVKPGDEVIVPNRTWIATAHAPHLLGARVRLVDTEQDRPIIDANHLEEVISTKTRAIIPVHMCGRSADMKAINTIANKHNITVIEDAAQALGSRNEQGFLGTQGDMGCFSFSVAKVISTGQGGFTVTKNKKLYERLVAMRTHGVGNVVDATWTQPGFNFRFTDVLAAIGIQQLTQLDKRIEKLKEIYRVYEDGLRDNKHVRLIPVNLNRGEVPVYIEVLCLQREKLISYLDANDIQARPFYPDLNQAEYLKQDIKLPESEPYGLYGLYLPSGPAQPTNNIHKVIQVLNQFSPAP